ncbi:hypothetical protein KCP73_14555 [Salmonella enterica subsp. enterica]|nr:hypothetical protein KCP73_14555 [Salmonella enterica subsp. enterica]
MSSVGSVGAVEINVIRFRADIFSPLPSWFAQLCRGPSRYHQCGAVPLLLDTSLAWLGHMVAGMNVNGCRCFQCVGGLHPGLKLH